MNEAIIYRAAFDLQIVAAILGGLAVMWFIGTTTISMVNDKNDWEP